MNVNHTASHGQPNKGLRILCPNGHLGFAPTRLGSFSIGVAAEPDLIACDSGSCDCGPMQEVGQRGNLASKAAHRVNAG